MKAKGETTKLKDLFDGYRDEEAVGLHFKGTN